MSNMYAMGDQLWRFLYLYESYTIGILLPQFKRRMGRRRLGAVPRRPTSSIVREQPWPVADDDEIYRPQKSPRT